jgi:hypothetical protein
MLACGARSIQFVAGDGTRLQTAARRLMAPTGTIGCDADGACRMSDLYSFDLADGLARGACPLCHAVSADVERWHESFRREGRQDPRARRRFYAAGGFCPRHAWLFHRLGEEARAGAGIADVYGSLAAHDLAALDELLSRAGGRRRRTLLPSRRARCSGCEAEADALERKTHFLADLLSTSQGREAYARSAGLCLPHLTTTVESLEDRRLALFLVEDWRRRLAEAHHRLAEYDRKRDHRFAHERTADDERAWTDIVRLYVGERP